MSNKQLVTVQGAVLFGLLAWSQVSFGREAGGPAEEAAVKEAAVQDAAVNEASVKEAAVMEAAVMEASDKEASAKGDGLSKAIVAFAAALAVGMCAIATGIAQSRIGAAACGALAERPETGGTVILLVAIPETMVILGFVVAVVMLFVL